jgi:disulfide bond formation protein DsbB
MTPLIEVFTLITSLSVIAMNIITLFLVYVLIINTFDKKKEGNAILTWISKHAFVILVGITILSLGGSYFYSLIAGFTPCKLCWFQRTFFYGFILLYSVGWLKAQKTRFIESGIFVCTLVLSVFTLIVSMFQYYGSMFNPSILAACEANGVSCSKNYFVYFGYINIPMMSLSAFALIFVVALVRIIQSSHNNK